MFWKNYWKNCMYNSTASARQTSQKDCLKKNYLFCLPHSLFFFKHNTVLSISSKHGGDDREDGTGPSGPFKGMMLTNSLYLMK